MMRAQSERQLSETVYTHANSVPMALKIRPEGIWRRRASRHTVRKKPFATTSKRDLRTYCKKTAHRVGLG